MAIDAMIPIGRGQRELIIGDRSTGKTTICVDTIINQARLNQAAAAAVTKTFAPLLHLRRDWTKAIQYRAASSPCLRSRSHALYDHRGFSSFRFGDQSVFGAFAGAAMGEWFMDNGRDALIIFDDLSKHAVAFVKSVLVLKRHRVVKRIQATCSTCTVVCSNVLLGWAKNTATVR